MELKVQAHTQRSIARLDYREVGICRLQTYDFPAYRLRAQFMGAIVIKSTN